MNLLLENCLLTDEEVKLIKKVGWSNRTFRDPFGMNSWEDRDNDENDEGAESDQDDD